MITTKLIEGRQMEEGLARLENLCKKEKEDAVFIMIPEHHNSSWISGRRVVQFLEIRDGEQQFDSEDGDLLSDILVLRRNRWQ